MDNEYIELVFEDELDDGSYIQHYGMPRRSGRYPWGSGDDPYQHSADFLSRVEVLKSKGWEETPENIKKEFGLTTNQYRIEKSLATNERRMLQVARAKSLKEDGLGPTEIGRKMGINESSVRSLLNSKSERNMNEAIKTAEFIKSQIKKKTMVDVGNGVEMELGISKEKLNQALTILEMQGYPVYKGGIKQATNPGQQTNQRVICAPGTEHKEIYELDRVKSLSDYTSHDNGETFDKFVYPKSLDSKRLMVRYAEEGGVERDGLIELRRGVEDISLGDAKYSQVRILVDDKKYLKGMAVYSDDMPPGVDVIFNTNKTKAQGYDKALKNIKDDPDNPFGSTISPKGQSYYIDKDGNKQLRLINKRADEGDWSDWQDNLPSQFLSKQPLSLAKKQLGIASKDKHDEFDEINALTNPTIKKYFLNKFAEECDSSAVNLKAAALPGQKYHVIIPINTMKDDEIFAPKYPDGTKLALIRYPHGGTFEIPIVTVNNKQKQALSVLGKDVEDAVGINARVAERLSGADFDGDTVMCIPTHNGSVKINSRNNLEGLAGFDSKSYAYSDEEIKNGTARIMKNTQTQMGVISNLITDMTLKGAKDDELARAVRHSMVVIDAEKHKLNYKQSEIDNNIAALKEKYQEGGASTLISRAKGEEPVNKRQGTPKVNLKGTPDYDPARPEGSLIYKDADDLTYTVRKENKRTGEVTYVEKTRTQKSTKMAETDDAYSLVSKANTPMERVYAEYANDMKGLANKARIEAANTGKIAYSPSAKAKYIEEVRSLESKLSNALVNAPREREAQRRANAEVDAKTKVAEYSKGDIKKMKQQALTKYRTEVGSVSRRNRNIDITDKEWEAIQSGAISENKLTKILANSDTDKLRQRATPRATTSLSDAKISRIRAMQRSGKSISEIANQMNVSSSTISKYLKEGA